MWGQEWVSRWTRWVVSSATNFPNNDIGLDDMSLGTPGSITSNVNYDDKLISFFSRLNYNWGERYLLTATIRADGSSKFSDNHKWGFFPSVSAAWRLSEEEFIKKLNLFSDLKLRAGYGCFLESSEVGQLSKRRNRIAWLCTFGYTKCRTAMGVK